MLVCCHLIIIACCYLFGNAGHTVSTVIQIKIGGLRPNADDQGGANSHSIDIESGGFTSGAGSAVLVKMEAGETM